MNDKVTPSTNEEVGQMRAVVDGEYIPPYECLWYHHRGWDDLAIVKLIARIEADAKVIAGLRERSGQGAAQKGIDR